MSGNHARDDYYQPGALIYRDVVHLSANLTDDVQAAWDNIDNGGGDILQISYTTPACDCWGLVNFHIRADHDNADQNLFFKVWDGTTDLIVCQCHPNANAQYVSTSGSKCISMSAGTAYTLTARYYVSVTGLEIDNTDAYTYMELMVFRKP